MFDLNPPHSKKKSGKFTCYGRGKARMVVKSCFCLQISKRQTKYFWKVNVCLYLTIVVNCMQNKQANSPEFNDNTCRVNYMHSQEESTNLQLTIKNSPQFNSFSVQPPCKQIRKKAIKKTKPDRFCKKCYTFNTPQWRRGPDGRKS